LFAAFQETTLMIFIAAAAAAAFVSLVIDMIEHGAEEGWRGSKVGLFYSDRCLSCRLAPLLSQLVTTPPKNFNSLRALAKSSQGDEMRDALSSSVTHNALPADWIVYEKTSALVW
jgi:hypothetical protein